MNKFSIEAVVASLSLYFTSHQGKVDNLNEDEATYLNKHPVLGQIYPRVRAQKLIRQVIPDCLPPQTRYLIQGEFIDAVEEDLKHILANSDLQQRNCQYMLQEQSQLARKFASDIAKRHQLHK